MKNILPSEDRSSSRRTDYGLTERAGSTSSMETRFDHDLSEAPHILNDVLKRAASRIGSRRMTGAGLESSDASQAHRQGSLSLTAGSDSSIEALINIPDLFKKREVNGQSVSTLQEWIGYVEDIGQERFQARLSDLMSSSNREELAIISLSAIGAADRAKLCRGAVFHLLMGYGRRLDGALCRETFMYFRRHIPQKEDAGKRLAALLDAFSDSEE